MSYPRLHDHDPAVCDESGRIQPHQYEPQRRQTIGRSLSVGAGHFAALR